MFKFKLSYYLYLLLLFLSFAILFPTLVFASSNAEFPQPDLYFKLFFSIIFICSLIVCAILKFIIIKIISKKFLLSESSTIGYLKFTRISLLIFVILFFYSINDYFWGLPLLLLLSILDKNFYFGLFDNVYYNFGQFCAWGGNFTYDQFITTIIYPLLIICIIILLEYLLVKIFCLNKKISKKKIFIISLLNNFTGLVVFYILVSIFMPILFKQYSDCVVHPYWIFFLQQI